MLKQPDNVNGTVIHNNKEYWFCTECIPPHLVCHKEVDHVNHYKCDPKSQQLKLAAATNTKTYRASSIDQKRFEEAIAKAYAALSQTMTISKDCDETMGKPIKPK